MNADVKRHLAYGGGMAAATALAGAGIGALATRNRRRRLKAVLKGFMLGGVVGGGGYSAMLALSRGRPSRKVMSFYDDILFPLKRESPLVSKSVDLRMYRPGFYNDVKIHNYAKWMFPGSSFKDARKFWGDSPDVGFARTRGRWNRRDGQTFAHDVFIRGGPNDATLVHELKHIQNLDSGGLWDPVSKSWKKRNNHSPEETKLLTRVYGFANDDVGTGSRINEMFTTHAEHQFKIYSDLWDKLGRKPSLGEYKSFVRAMSKEALRASRGYCPNLYQQKADDRLLDTGAGRGSYSDGILEAYRRALLDVAKNDVGKTRGSGSQMNELDNLASYGEGVLV